MVKESIGVFEIQVERKDGSSGVVSVNFKTTDINAVSGKDYYRNLLRYFQRFNCI